MKKLSIYAAMLLATAMTWSCANTDNLADIDNVEPTYKIESGDLVYNLHKVGSFMAEPGAEVTLTLGVYDLWDIYAVDFGDGNLLVDSVCYQNGGMRDEVTGLSKEGTSHKSATRFSGTVGGEGLITVYGNSDLWYLNCSGGVVPFSNDTRMQKLVQISITGANVDAIVMEHADSLKTFAFNNSPVQRVDMSGAPNLTSLTINNTSASKYEPQLTSIDLSANTKLESVNIQGNQNSHGKLKTIDLSNNTALKGMGLYLQYNELTEVKLGENALTTINLSGNQLTEFDLTKLPSLKTLYISDNQLTKLDFSKLVAGGDIQVQNNQLTELVIPVSVKNLYAQNNQIAKYDVADCTNRCQIENNKLNFATLPVRPAGLNTIAKKLRFIYYPQAPYEVPASVKELDLISQFTAQGVQDAPVTTVYSFATASGTPLVENTDYQQTEPGKFIFIKQQSEKVHAIMYSDAFPMLTAEEGYAFVTTDFNVEVSEGTEPQTGGALFSWEAGTATGGSVVGNGADSGKVTDETITVSSKKANIESDNITITLDKALEAGDIISITGYRKKDTDANGTLYFLFETGATIDEGSDVKWNNIHENVGQQPNTNTYEVTAEMAGSKTIKLARSKASTNVFITKIEIIRK